MTLWASGNTSTDVEKTNRPAIEVRRLHGRGEDNDLMPKDCAVLETPPRTWRRPVTRRNLCRSGGNTSTDVEKTAGLRGLFSSQQKHLHGRGEDHSFASVGFGWLETPPRTWRRLIDRFLKVLWQRNTSTDVEKTYSRSDHYAGLQKHLHGRGEDSVEPQNASPPMETPPRTWRRRRRFPEHHRGPRNTSTDVEKTDTAADYRGRL